MTKANLGRDYLQGADLRRADLSRADLRDTDLTGAILDDTVLTGAQADSDTSWPTDVDAERRHELGIIEIGHDGPDEMPAVKA